MTALLSAEGLCKSYTRRSLIRAQAPREVLGGVSIAVAPGESLAVLGRSGSGKSTLMRLLMGLEKPSAGRVSFRGQDLQHLDAAGTRNFRASVQMVFQDSIGAANPRFRLGDIVAEPLRHLTALDKRARTARVAELLASVGLCPEDARKHPSQVSGGQLQRVCIARALATDPALLVLDEAVSNLDILLQGQIIDLIRSLRTQRGMALVFITHDLRLVRLLCERVAVMDAGRILETGPVDRRLQLQSRAGRALQDAILPALPKAKGMHAGAGLEDVNVG
ncbi:nickel import ATP-binding protein NikE [Rhodovulum sp. BSW8]|uniref:nickel import ATP-binding protein NikE n=1 Tax=Rhodovulum sp. BSW8 TaxID=2259645 RepID=UPI000DE3DEBE|nr:nickel import ATP-binding protein NikE [Rhodovulum sp. BSW8]RBO53888.1 nickel import ATP-binding protein NikE [Rhodovulum sp. BSW8]